MKSTLIILLFGFITIGCSPSPTGKIDYQGFTDLEIQEIQTDLAQLGTIKNHDVSFIAQGNLGIETGGYTIVGEETSIGSSHCTILLDPTDFGTPDQPGLFQQSVVWHEYGHCAGLYHVPDQNAIMYFAVSDFDLYSTDELNTFINEVRQLGAIQ